jgi:triphosphoribosyl-dephospho-CoA synthase
MNDRSQAVARAFIAACTAELAALKPGNVHVYRGGHNMQVGDFIKSAEIAAGPIAAPGIPIGQRIFNAVAASMAAVRQNTNLGIVLLCAPLAAAAENCYLPLRDALSLVLLGLDRQDAEFAFQAIALAAPAGLGKAPRHDVSAPAIATLREAMEEAQTYDLIARQYCTNFADIFDLGLPQLQTSLQQWADARWSTVAVYLRFLSHHDDSHIGRKYGEALAAAVRVQAGSALQRLLSCSNPDDLINEMLVWDDALKQHRINPGTSADLTVATLFASELNHLQASTILPSGLNND